jgi:outer-membrane receptor for ferric coprogen and ferric-rhodotorulic acid
VGRGLKVGGGLNWQSEIYGADITIAPGNVVRFTQGSYAVLNLMASYPFTDQLTASVNLNNVLDERYYTSTTASYYGTPREVRASLKYSF